MVTAASLVQDSFEILGVYAPGEDVRGPDLARGMQVLNKMMDSWSNESLACYANLEQQAPLIPNQQSYTIGPNGNFNMTRPLSIRSEPGSCYVRDANGFDYPMAVLNQDQWNLIGLKGSQADIPSRLFYDPQYPLGIINIFPVPTIAYTLFFDSRLQLSTFAGITSALSLPPGYEAAITSNLAVWLKPYFRDGELGPDAIVMAKTTLAAVKRQNVKTLNAGYDPEIVSRGSPVYNIYRDTNGL